ncbi:MAG: hypothetical protein GY759_22050 [Chloroflexi bacterium]|nr:hypothetical protein [Chloroflexota bacterium]
MAFGMQGIIMAVGRRLKIEDSGVSADHVFLFVLTDQMYPLNNPGWLKADP